MRVHHFPSTALQFCDPLKREEILYTTLNASHRGTQHSMARYRRCMSQPATAAAVPLCRGGSIKVSNCVEARKMNPWPTTRQNTDFPYRKNETFANINPRAELLRGRHRRGVFIGRSGRHQGVFFFLGVGWCDRV